MTKKSHNWLYLRGDRHIDDKRYQELCAEQGIEIPDEHLWTPEINKTYIDQDPEKNGAYIRKKLAAHGLLKEAAHD